MNLELKRINALILILFISLNIGAQVAPEKYWIQFTDKDNSTFSVANPIAFLSQRAIDRRLAQGIAITAQDFPVNASYISGVQQTASVDVLASSKWLNGILIQTTDTNGLAQIMNLPFVDSLQSESVENPEGVRSHKMDVNGKMSVNEGLVSNVSEGLNYGYAEDQNKMLHIEYLHDLGYTGSGMVIAVLDAGFNGTNTTAIVEPLFTNNQILGTWDFVLDQPVDYTSHSDHGAYVLNCMGANLPGTYIGTAPDADYWLLRTEDAPTENIIEEYNWVAGAEFADSVGADVLNTSLGYTTFDDSSKSHTYSDLDGNTTIITIGADLAASKGMLVVNSAGNSGNNNWNYIGAPADGDSVLAIGAVGSDEMVTAFSSRGPSYDGRVKPNVMAMGGSVPMPNGADSVFYINGTSFSGPILAGAAACFWQSRPSYTSMEIFKAIEESSDRFTNPDDDYGYGIPNFGLAYFLITGENDLSLNKSRLKVFPNPTTGLIYTEAIQGKHIEIVVTDLSGKVIYTSENLPQNNNQTEVDFTNFKNGMYLLQVHSELESKVVSVIKN